MGMAGSLLREILGISAARKCVPRDTPAPCLNCGFGKALFLGTKVSPDFDTTAKLTPELRKAFSERMDGICVRCGIYQAFHRFTYDQLRSINYMGKDVTTSETAFHEYPAPADFVAKHNTQLFGLRTRKWLDYFRTMGVKPANSLFIRPFFGGSVKFVRDEYGAKVAGIDMSQNCLRHVKDLIPEFIAYSGAINGMLEGDFLASGPYDSIFVFHTLTHACEPHTMLKEIHSLLSDGGFAVFSHECVRKPTNPFHMLHLGELQLESLLLRHFQKVDRVDGCDDPAAECISDYSTKGDSPDLVAWR